MAAAAVAVAVVATAAAAADATSSSSCNLTMLFAWRRGYCLSRRFAVQKILKPPSFQLALEGADRDAQCRGCVRPIAAMRFECRQNVGPLDSFQFLTCRRGFFSRWRRRSLLHFRW